MLVTIPSSGRVIFRTSPVVASVFEAIVFFVASRGHHADVGGTTPGSMPFSKTIADEGAAIKSFKLVDEGLSRGWYHETLGQTRNRKSRDRSSPII